MENTSKAFILLTEAFTNTLIQSKCESVNIIFVQTDHLLL